jgi:chemotaxis protein methyltransferase CheR
MTKNEIENIEIELFLNAIFLRYGYDFRNYAQATVKRRIRNILLHFSYNNVSELIPRLLYDKLFFKSIILNFSVTVSEMFRDPFFYKSLRENVIPYLKTYPFVKIWVAGCATGQEVYSLAILLKEENFYDRATIFATDFNDIALKKAEEGIYSIKEIASFEKNYVLSGGKAKFSDYYITKYDSAKFDDALKERITFANHNLASDSVFGEMNLILCRNVLIYFNKELQNRVLNLYKESLVNNGFLCLGIKESLIFSDVNEDFETIDENHKIFQYKKK